MNQGNIEATILDQCVKGMPGGIEPFRLGDIQRHGWNVLKEDLPLPLAVLKESALSHNGRWMQRFLARSGAVIAPHGKTTMSPQLFRRQLGDGAWAITLATVHQLQVAREFGFHRIVLANQLVGRQGIRYVLDELRRDPAFDFYCVVDSTANVEQLATEAAAARLDRSLQLLLEGGFEGGRTGCRSVAAALQVARAIQQGEPYLALRGVEGFEGLLHGATPQESQHKATRFVDYLVEIATACAAEGLFAPGPVILSAGGSRYYDIVADRFGGAKLGRDTLVVTRSGCYFTHDSVIYREAFQELTARTPEVEALGTGLLPALEVWAYVQSRPEATKALLTMGKRDVSYDDLPVPLKWVRPERGVSADVAPGHEVTGLNDQHCHLRIPADSPLAVGDMVCFGISHPCLTFDKWQVIPVVDDDYNVISAVRTYF
jgi:D-serine dehydratase